MSTAPCHFYISNFDQTISLTKIASLGTIPSTNQIAADAVATLPIGLSVLNAIFQYSSSETGNNALSKLPTFQPAEPHTLVIDSVAGENILLAMNEHIINAYTMKTLFDACHNYPYLNPSVAMLPTTITNSPIPVSLNGGFYDTTSFPISSGNNSGMNTATNKAKGPQIVAYPITPSTPIDETQELVKYDFLRYISNSLFNTPNGVALFTNQVEVFDDIDAKCAADLTNINTLLTPNVTSPSSWITDNNNHSYCTDLSSICPKIIDIMYTNYPARFDSTNIVTTGSPYCHVPFQAGDTIRHVVTLNAASTQTDVIPHTGNPPAPISRAYEIIWEVVDDSNPANTVNYGIVPAPGDASNTTIPY